MYTPKISASNSSFNLEATNPVRPSTTYSPSPLPSLMGSHCAALSGLTHGDPPASAFGALGLEVSVSEPGQFMLYLPVSSATAPLESASVLS